MTNRLISKTIALRGAGDLATGVAIRLVRSGFRVVLSELPAPLCIRRTVAFANAAFSGETRVEDWSCRVAANAEAVPQLWENEIVPLLIDPELNEIRRLRPDVLIDARIMKTWRNDTSLNDAELVIGLGPGFRAGENVHAVVETNRGHHSGRVFWEGEAEPDTGVPGLIRGEGTARVLKAPCAGVFQPLVDIGTAVVRDQPIAEIHEANGGAVVGTICASLDGIVRGVLYPGLTVKSGLKVMDIDPRGDPAHCFSVSDKALSIAGGVLEAILTFYATKGSSRENRSAARRY